MTKKLLLNIDNTYNFLLGLLLKPYLFLRWQYNQKNASYNERSIEYSYALNIIKNEIRPRILDVGTGKSCFAKLLEECGYNTTSLDKVKGYWSSYLNPHYHVVKADITKPLVFKEGFDVITCLSVLEHIDEYDKAVRNMIRLLRPNGMLIMSFPYNKEIFIPNVYEHKKASYGKDFRFKASVYNQKIVDGFINENLVVPYDVEYYKAFTGDFWTFGHRLPKVRKAFHSDADLICITLQKVKMINDKGG